MSGKMPVSWGAGIFLLSFLYKFNTLILQFMKKQSIDKSYKQLCLLLFSISLIV